MAKDYEKMYQDLIDQEGLFHSGPRSSGASFIPDDEAEEFLTSKEIVKMKNHPEDNPGMILPSGPVEIEEEVHFKRYSKRREHKYTETEMREIEASCVGTIVHDYSEHDEYHMSDEERARNDSLQELGLKLGGLKRMYRKVDQFIEAMRVVVEAWELLEKRENFVHTREEFFQLVASGKIYHNKILLPKLKGISKYNMDMIIKYISNPELDPKDLVPIETTIRDSWYDQFDDIDDENMETEEEQMNRLLSPEEVQFILDYADNPPEIKVGEIKPSLIKGYDRRSFLDSKKSGKKVGKKKKYAMDSLHDLLLKIQNNPANNSDMTMSRSYMLTQSMFEVPKEEKNPWDDLFFDGSWANDEDVFLLDLATREELLKQHPPRQRYLTYADEELNKFFQLMEENGINVVELRRKMNSPENANRTIEEKAVKKENKKVEAALIQRITQLNQSPKFKKLVAKAEKAINEQFEQY